MTVRRRSDSHRAARWLWSSRSFGSRVARLALLPLSALWRTMMVVRAWWFTEARGQSAPLPLPSVAIGNLTVGGSGKTPIAGWVAAFFAERGLTPGILLRGTGGDETLVHADEVPSAVVVADPDRRAGAQRAVESGANVLVLDDAYQRIDIPRDLNLCLISVESAQAVRWSLPAGPWREPFSALDRADFVIVTRKRADALAASRFADELRAAVSVPVAVVHLGLQSLRGLISGQIRPMSWLQERKVIAASAIADPGAFVAQLKGTGAHVQVATWKDHHQFRDEDVAWLAHAARRAEVLVITAKDGVKLRNRWPASVPEPYVAILQVSFEAGEAELRAALDRVVPHH